MDAKLSQGEHIGDLDELEEEFNVVPANRAQEVSKYSWNAGCCFLVGSRFRKNIL
jgi:hypothetical protein